MRLFGLEPVLQLADPDRRVLDGPGDELEDDFDMRWFYSVTPEYRLDGTCGRVAVRDDYSDRSVEGFVVPGADGDQLSLVDSLGRFVTTLVASSASPTREADADGWSVPTVRSSPVSFDPAGPALVTDHGRLSLTAVAPGGRWYARPDGVRLDGSDLVIVHTCDLLGGQDGFCGVEADAEGRPLADPPFPYVTHIAVRVVRDGTAITLEPFGPDWQESVFASVNLSDRRRGRPEVHSVKPL